MGLGAGAGRGCRNTGWRGKAARLWIEVVRGVPIMVLLLYVAFVLSPALVFAWNWVSGWFGQCGEHAIFPSSRGRSWL